MKVTKRYHFHKGDPPGDQAQSWMTQEDWDKYDKHVEELKASGEYGKPDYVDIVYDPEMFKAFDIPKRDPDEPMFSNYGLLIPGGDGDYTRIEWLYKNPNP